MAAKKTRGSRGAVIQEAVAHYESLRTEFDHLGKILLMRLVDDESLKGLIHSGKYRTKDPDHLTRKICRKDVERLKKRKQRPPFIRKANLLKQVDDLVGVRLLHLHTKQMPEIDPAIQAILARNNYSILEGPFVYIWDVENKAFFKSIKIKPIERREMYTSVHYVVSSAERPDMRIELQVRTLMEEVWGEVSHKIDYPELSEVLACREQLKVLARITSGCSRLVDSIFAAHEEAKAAASSPDDDGTN